ncbi:MAG: hypothetical protein ABR586_06725, partial [Thermoplasmatota archaeon]
MNKTPLALAAVLLLGLSASAAPPGHLSLTSEFLSAPVVDFKDGTGLVDPVNGSPCDALVYGVRNSTPPLPTWTVDQDMGTNLNGPGVGISNIGPPLVLVGGGFPNSFGIPLGVIPGCGPGVMWLIWSGMNWRAAEADSTSELALCPQVIATCIPAPGPNLLLVAAACVPTAETFAHTYNDGKDKNGGTDDAQRLKNDVLRCPVAHAHDYTSSVILGAGGAVLDPDHPIKNEAVVHAGWGTTYMAACWSIDYVDFANPLNPVAKVAQAHDWKLIIDTNDNPLAIATALAIHYGPQRFGDAPAAPATAGMRGFYSRSSTPAGENGFG